MFVTVAVVMCKLLVSAPTIAPDRDCTAEESKIVEVVTDTDLNPGLDLFGCYHGEAELAKWQDSHPVYGRVGWRIGRVMCVPGHYEPPGRA